MVSRCSVLRAPVSACSTTAVTCRVSGMREISSSTFRKSGASVVRHCSVRSRSWVTTDS